MSEEKLRVKWVTAQLMLWRRWALRALARIESLERELKTYERVPWREK